MTFKFNPFTDKLDLVGTGGSGGGVTQINGDTGGATGPVITLTGGISGAKFTGDNVSTITESFNFIDLADSSATDKINVKIGGNRFISNNVPNSSTYIGINSGNTTATGTGNTSIGRSTLSDVTSGESNTGIGVFGLTSITTGSDNTSIGFQSLEFVTVGSNNTAIGSGALKNVTGSENTAIGEEALNVLTTGSNNTAIGSVSVGSNYLLGESSNIIIQNTGTVADNNTIRIGTQGSGSGQQNKAFMAGIVGVTTSNSNFVTVNTSTGQLGAAGGSQIIAGNTGTASGGTITITTGASNVEGTSVFTASGSTVTQTFTDANENTGLGHIALDALSSGQHNSAFGSNVLSEITSGSNNCIFGHNSGAVSTGSFNSGLGQGCLVSPGASSRNTVVGGLALSAGAGVQNDNIAIGYQAGLLYTGTESSNLVIGHPGVTGESNKLRIGVFGIGAGQQDECFIAACYQNPGVHNTFVGEQSGNDTLSGQSNVSTGFQCLLDVTSGSNNNAYGVAALQNLTSGVDNVALGNNSLHLLLTGEENIAIGVLSGSNCTGSESSNILIRNNGVTSESNTIRIGDFGSSAGQQNKCYIASAFHNPGTNNTFVGSSSANDSLSGSDNIAIGFTALAGATGASESLAIGTESLHDVTTGSGNIALGFRNLNVLTTGASNIGLGNGALRSITTGFTNIAIGDVAGSSCTGSDSSNILISNLGTSGDNHTIRLGTTGTADSQQNRAFIAGIRGTTTGVNDAIAVLIDSAGQLGTVSSSIRYKENVQPLGSESSSVLDLNPVSFNFILDESKKLAFGLIAEEVEKFMPSLVVYNEKGEPETVKYHDLPVLLLNEMKKMAKEIADLKAERKSCEL